MQESLLLFLSGVWIIGSVFLLLGLTIGLVVCAKLAWQGNHYLYVHWMVASCLGIFATLHTLISAGF